MKNLIKHVENVNALHKLWKEGDTVIVGVSGGPDSMCLFDVLVKVAQKKNLKIIVAHVNYSLRGDDSKKDAELVQKISEKHNLLFELKDCSENCKKNENSWRVERYDFFKKLVQKHNAKSIAVAHNKNDQAETMLLHMLRGAGLAGMAGMQYKNDRGVIRPLLNVERSNILQYCKKNDIVYRIDESNENMDFMRNKVRGQIVPVLEESFGVNVVDVLARMGASVADDYAFIESTIKPFWEKTSDNSTTFSVKTFQKLHNSQQRTAIRMMIEEVRGSVSDIEKGFIEEVRKIIFSTKGKNQEIFGKDLKITRKGDTVKLAY